MLVIHEWVCAGICATKCWPPRNKNVWFLKSYTVRTSFSLILTTVHFRTEIFHSQKQEASMSPQTHQVYSSPFQAFAHFPSFLCLNLESRCLLSSAKTISETSNCWGFTVLPAYYFSIKSSSLKHHLQPGWPSRKSAGLLISRVLSSRPIPETEIT